MISLRKANKGNVAFLGGPLYFLPELRKRFIGVELSDDQVIFPDNSQLFSCRFDFGFEEQEG